MFPHLQKMTFPMIKFFLKYKMKQIPDFSSNVHLDFVHHCFDLLFYFVAEYDVEFDS